MKSIHGRDYDRDKNLSYRPQDESGDISSDNILLHKHAELDASTDIITLIRRNYNELKKSIDIINDKHSKPLDKQCALLNFVNLWTAHAQAEESTLYDEVQFSKMLHARTDSAYEEHEVIQMMIVELESLNFRLEWNKQIETKAKALAEVVSYHLRLEEKFLDLAAELLSKEDLIMMGREFVRQFEVAEAHNKASLKPSQFHSGFNQ